jgi:cyclophilin family peptidyl-prolyl cis-trans isomerase
MNRIIYPIIGCFLFLQSYPFISSANSLAIFRTTLGEMAVELFDDDKPQTVRNFIRLTELGRYNNSFFHVNAAGVIVQGGGFLVANPSSTSLVSQIFSVVNLGSVTNEFSTGTIYSNVYGTIAMAKVAGNPDSATSQWFFNLGSNPGFDVDNGGFTVFGRVIAGTNVLEQFTTRSNGFGTVNLGGQFSLMPVTYTGTNFPHYNELIYAGVEIMKIIVVPQTDGTRILAWNSPTSLVCRVEYNDTGIIGAWSLLHQTNGNGLIQSVIDTNAASATRNYRITVPPE